MDEIARQLQEVYDDVLKKLDSERTIAEQLQEACEKHLAEMDPKVIAAPRPPTLPTIQGAAPTIKGHVVFTITKPDGTSAVFEGDHSGGHATVRPSPPKK